MSEQKRFAIYARTATTQELGPNVAMAQQIHECKEYGISKGYALVEGQIHQEVISGLSKDRPALLALLKAAKEGAFDILLILKYDRLARRYELCSEFISRFEEAGVQIEVAQEAAGDREAWQIMQEIRAHVYQIERQRITSRSKHGKAAKKSHA